jgi:hypothetical protein
MNHTTQQPLASQRLREVARRRISLALSLAETQYAQIHGEFFQGLGHLRQAANTRSARRQREAESAKEAAAQTDIALRGPEVDDQTAGQAANGSTMEHGGEDDAATRAVAGTMYMHATSVKRTAARKREEKESEQKQGVDGLAFYAEMGKRMSDPAHRQLMHATRKDEKAARDAANSITVHLTSARRHRGGASASGARTAATERATSILGKRRCRDRPSAADYMDDVAPVEQVTGTMGDSAIDALLRESRAVNPSLQGASQCTGISKKSTVRI